MDANILAYEHLENATNTPQENIVFTNPTLGVYQVVIKSYKINPLVMSPSEKIDFTLTIVDQNKRINTKGVISESSELIFCEYTLD